MFIYPNKPIRVYDIDKILPTVKNWICQSKWDGKRVHVACDSQGSITLFGRQNQIFKETAQWQWLADLPLARPFFLDGELLRSNQIYVWDYAILDGQNCYQLPYQQRWEKISQLKTESKNTQKIAVVDSVIGANYNQILSRKPQEPELEGCIFKLPTGTAYWGITSTGEVPCMIKYRFK